ncbi:MAG: hypothetical protein IKH71_12230 [Oscillospiraceae bacterium]|nr:hypothetical protein [Oscillospiraceae bacterium]
MIKKVISAVLAVSFVSSVFITAYAADTEKAKKYFKPADLSGMFDFMTGKSSDKASENLDVNEDGVVNILDTISMKESIYEDYSYYKHVLSSSDYEKDINDSQKLNRMAATVSEVVTNAIRDGKSPGADYGSYFTYDDESELADYVNRILLEKYGYRDMKWKAVHAGFDEADVVCAVNNEKTGAFPVGIPDDIDIPFDMIGISNVNFGGQYERDWHKYYRSVAELNDDARFMFENISYFIPTAFKRADYTKDKIYVSGVEDDNFSNLLNRLNSKMCYNNYRWSVHIANGEVISVYLTDFSGKITGAYPAAVPQNLAIPYTEGLDEYASGEKSWKDDFSDKISEDAETASLPDYPEVSENDALLKAYNYFSYMDLESNQPIEKIKDGVYSYENFEEELPDLMSDRLFCFMDPLYKHEHINLTFLDGKLSEVEYINDGCKKSFKVSYDRYLETKEEVVKMISSRNEIKTVGVSTPVTDLNGDDKVPAPDHRLYYSTDADDNAIIRLRTEEELKESSEDISDIWNTSLPYSDQNEQS